MITNDWKEVLSAEFRKPYYKALYDRLKNEYTHNQIFPKAADMFNAFNLTPYEDVKVVILGQDPYHNDGQAHGLSFSVMPGTDTPPSLVNIYKELRDELG